MLMWKNYSHSFAHACHNISLVISAHKVQRCANLKLLSDVGVSQLFIANKKDMASESKEELKRRLEVSLRLFTLLVVALMCRTDSLGCRLCCMYYLISQSKYTKLIK